MNDNLQKTRKMRSIREEKARIMAKESELSTPKLTNLKYVPMTYEWFGELAAKREESSRKAKIEMAKKFLVVTLLFYSPATLAGGKMIKGLRNVLAQLFSLNAPTAVSNYCTDALAWYDRYKSFQKEVDYFYEEILVRLEAEEILSS